MCGILGTVPASETLQFEKALTTLAHRGPDNSGIWTDNAQVSIGQRRLAILDLSEDGNQPMFDASGRYAIVLNGEIYNFIEIQKELENKGYKFKSTSDTEILLYSYIEWGSSCLNKFNGMWAFAIWDKSKKELFLARDRFGKKPLFYAFIKNKFVFASEMKAIYPFLESIRPSKDFEWMANHIFSYETTEKCLVEGIKRFPNGHYAFMSNHKIQFHRYWNTLDNLIKIPENYDQQVEQFRELFIDACKIRMRSDVQLGTALSGGLDSSATISTMAYIAKHSLTDRVNKNWQHAFVATFPNTPLDESYFAQKVVDHLNISATFLPVDPLKSIEKLYEYLYKFEELYITSPIPMVELYGAIRKNGTIVTLDGHGADELFSGYAGNVFEAISDFGLNKTNLKQVYETYIGLFPKQYKKRNMYIEFWDYFLRRKYDKLIGRIPKSKDSKHQNFYKLDTFNKLLYLLTHDTILPTLLRNYDRYAMINGVEIRMPFMDYRIVCFAMSLPWKSKIRSGFTKSIIRDAVKPFLPDEVTFRKTKIGFNTPIVNWMKKDLKQLFLDMINSQSFKTCELINSKIVKQKIEHVINNSNAAFQDGEKAWTLLTPYLWEQSIIKTKQ